MPQHHCHHHELSLKSYKYHNLGSYELMFTCDGCKMLGYGERYRCIESCDYDLHKECMHLAPTRTLELFTGRTLSLHDQPPPPEYGRKCNVCRKKVEGFVYHNKEADVDVHPLCASLERKIRVDGIEFELKEGTRERCSWCNEGTLKESTVNVPGFSYVSTCEEEECSFHVHCLMTLGIISAAARSMVTADLAAVPEVSENRVQSYRGSGRRRKFFVKLFFKVALSMLIGDPTTMIASVAVEMFAL